MKKRVSKGLIFGLFMVFLIGSVSAAVSITSPADGSYHDSKINQIDWSNNTAYDNCWWGNGTTNTSFACTDSIISSGVLSSVTEGWNNWTVYANDSLGTVDSADVGFWVDSINPIINVLTPSGIGYTSSNLLSLFVELIETNPGGFQGFSGNPDGSSNYVWRQFVYPDFSGSEQGSYTLNSTNVSDASLTPSVLQEGNYSFTVKSRDKYPNGSTIREVTDTGIIVRDTIDPITSVDSPSDNSNHSGTVNIISSAVDNTSITTDVSEVNNITIDIWNGVYSNMTSTTSSPLNYNWISSAVADGAYNITSTSTDNAGNSHSTMITINVDNTPPTGTVTLGTATIYDGDLVQEVTVTYDEVMGNGTNPTITFTGNSGAATSNGDGTWATNQIWTENFTITDANEETVGVSVASSNAQDLVGNVEGPSVADTFNIDTKNPTVGVDSLLTNDADPQLTGTVDDNAATIQVTVDGNGYAATNNADGTWTLADNTISPLLTEGIYNVSVTATDTVGNIGSDSTIDELEIDLTAPTVTITSSESDPTRNSPISATATFDEDVSGFVIGDLTIGNGVASNFVAVDAKTYTFNITPSSDGSVTVDIAGGVAQDLAGNGNTAATQFSITYDSTAPTTTDDALSGWQTADFNVNLSATDALSGVSYINYSYNGGAWTQVFANDTLVLINQEGNLTLDYYAVDIVGNVESTNTAYVALDKTAPSLTNETNLSSNAISPMNTDNYLDNLTISMNASELVDWGTTTVYDSTGSSAKWFLGPSGVISNVEVWDGTLTNGSLAQDGVYTINTTITDMAGNTETIYLGNITVDNTVLTITGATSSSITSSSAIITWATDEFSDSTTYYGINTSTTENMNSSVLVTSHSLTLTGLSASTLYFYNVTSCDVAGNCNISTQYNFTTSADSSGGGSSGGGGGGSSGTKYYTCSEWGEWSECTFGSQNRTCVKKLQTSSDKGVKLSKFEETEARSCVIPSTTSSPPVEETGGSDDVPSESSGDKEAGSNSGITGAVIGFARTTGGLITLITLGTVGLGWAGLVARRKKWFTKK